MFRSMREEVASSIVGSLLFIDSAPSMLYDLQICTTRWRAGPSPCRHIPSALMGTHRPARAPSAQFASTSSIGLLSSSFSAGNHSSSPHWRDFFHGSPWASPGPSQSIDMGQISSFGFVVGQLADGYIARCQRHDKQSLKREHRPRSRFKDDVILAAKECQTIPDSPDLFPGYASMEQQPDPGAFSPRRRQGTPMLLLPCFSETHVVASLAPQLADQFT